MSYTVLYSKQLNHQLRTQARGELTTVATDSGNVAKHTYVSANFKALARVRAVCQSFECVLPREISLGKGLPYKKDAGACGKFWKESLGGSKILF